MAAQDSRMDKTKARRLKRWSAALFVFSIAQLAIQVAVLVIFKPFYNEIDPSAWDEVYNGLIIASGALDWMCSFLMICCLASSISSGRESSSRCIIFLALTIALLGSIASVVVSSFEIHWIRHSESHPCQRLNATVDLNCDLWFDLEVAVADCAGLNAVFILVIIIVASLKPKVKPPTPERAPVQQAHHDGITVQHVAAPIVEPVSAPLPEVTEPEPHPPPMKSEESNETSEPGDDMLTYAHQLRKMTREELEREMTRQFQMKFLKELRIEIDRRSLFAAAEEASSQPKSQAERVRRHSSRRSDASSATSSVRGASRASSPRPPMIEMPRVRSVSPPSRKAPPTPDYDLNEEIII